jgi:hypothetical protein
LAVQNHPLKDSSNSKHSHNLKNLILYNSSSEYSEEEPAEAAAVAEMRPGPRAFTAN